MREIKFRGISVHELASGNRWLYGNVYIGEYSYIEDMPVDEKTVGQYTGLKDKNGKEIFEGDIERDESGSLSVVCYLQKYGAYCFVPVVLYLHEDYENKVNYEYGTDCYFHNAVPSIYSEIVGNIYEDPELLEGDSQ